jgi:DNA-binding MarR family transcriptional regulator
MPDLRFNGSLWLNLDIALRNLDQVYGKAIAPLDLTVIECYLLQALYQKDGQHATNLAHSIGRAPTSFTPILDKLANKELIERRPDPADRRAIYIHLAPKGKKLQKAILASFNEVESRIKDSFSSENWNAFEQIIARMQTFSDE